MVAVFAVVAFAEFRAFHSHLEALAVLLEAVRFFAVAALEVARLVVHLVFRIGLRDRGMAYPRLHLGPEGGGVALDDLLYHCFALLAVVVVVVAGAAVAFLAADLSGGEAIAVQLEALGFLAVAHDGFGLLLGLQFPALGVRALAGLLAGEFERLL